ncbi:MAG: NfeD family protein, partial [Bacteroidales bacterium]|nr:NfeD family protein [Bacteroidales bacterium]
ILGLLSIAGGVVLAFTEFGHITGLIVLGLVIALLSIFTWLILRSGTWKKLSLKESISSKVDNDPSEKGLIPGTIGITLSRLSPTGKVRFADTDTEVRSQGGIINSGTSVVITRIEDNRIVVKELDTNNPQATQ